MKPIAMLGAAVALSVAAAPAGAATIVITAEGTLSSGRDDFNTLGLGTDLAGQFVSMIFTFDDERTDNMSWYEGPGGSGVSGWGPDAGGGYDDSPGSAVVTIGGLELAILGDYWSSHSVGYSPDPDIWDSGGSLAQDQTYFRNEFGDVIGDKTDFASVQVSGPHIFPNGSLHQNIDITSGPDIHISGGFSFSSWNYDPDNWSSLKYISGTLDPENTTYSVRTFGAPTGAVPEPATWAMMILGFGAIGGAMRRRQRPVRIRYA